LEAHICHPIITAFEFHFPAELESPSGWFTAKQPWTFGALYKKY